MIILFIFIGFLILGIILSIILDKAKLKLDVQDFFEFLGGLLIAINTFTIIVSLGFGAIARLPLLIEGRQNEFEENYKTLTLLLENYKSNVLMLSDDISQYNTDVKNYYIYSESLWTNWFNPKLEKEPEYINLEDYLA